MEKLEKPIFSIVRIGLKSFVFANLSALILAGIFAKYFGIEFVNVNFIPNSLKTSDLYFFLSQPIFYFIFSTFLFNKFLKKKR